MDPYAGLGTVVEEEPDAYAGLGAVVEDGADPYAGLGAVQGEADPYAGLGSVEETGGNAGERMGLGDRLRDLGRRIGEALRPVAPDGPDLPPVRDVPAPAPAGRLNRPPPDVGLGGSNVNAVQAAAGPRVALGGPRQAELSAAPEAGLEDYVYPERARARAIGAAAREEDRLMRKKWGPVGAQVVGGVARSTLGRVGRELLKDPGWLGAFTLDLPGQAEAREQDVARREAWSEFDRAGQFGKPGAAAIGGQIAGELAAFLPFVEASAGIQAPRVVGQLAASAAGLFRTKQAQLAVLRLGAAWWRNELAFLAHGQALAEPGATASDRLRAAAKDAGMATLFTAAGGTDMLPGAAGKVLQPAALFAIGYGTSGDLPEEDRLVNGLAMVGLHYVSRGVSALKARAAMEDTGRRMGAPRGKVEEAWLRTEALMLEAGKAAGVPVPAEPAAPVVPRGPVAGTAVPEAAPEAAPVAAGMGAGRPVPQEPVVPAVVEPVASVEAEPPAGTSVIDEGAPDGAEEPIVRTVEFPVADLKVQNRLKQFKRGADPETGVVRGQQLQGKFERVGTGPILVWQSAEDGSFEVATGRNRFDLARRTGERTIPAQVVREADGFSLEMAQRFDAEANIRDGQGDVSDYAHYFRHYPELTEDTARDKGLLARAKGKAGWALGRDAADDLYALFQAGRLSEAKAVAIAQNAPGNAALQAAGMEFAREAGVEASDIANYLQDLQRRAGDRAATGAQGDLFGFDDSALRDARAIAKAASRKQNEILGRLQVLRAGAKVSSKQFKKIAGEYGINVENPDALEQAQVAAQAELEEWKQWRSDPVKVAALQAEASGAAPGRAAARIDLTAGREIPADALAALRELDAEEGRVVREGAGVYAGDLAAGTRGESAFRHVLRLVAESRRGEAATVGRADVLATRALQNKARALLEAVDAGRIAEDEAQRRWVAAQAEIARGQARIERRQAAAVPGAETVDMFAPAGPAPGMLLEGQGEYGLDSAGAGDVRELQIQQEFYNALFPERTAAERHRDLEGEGLQSQVEAERNAAETLRRASGTVLGNAMLEEFKREGKIDLVGQRVRSAQDLALVGQIARNPSFETVGYFVVKNGVVTHQEVVSSRLPGSSATFAGRAKTTGEINRLADATVDRIAQIARDSGADGVWILHNHPGQTLEPSSNDRDVTAWTGRRLHEQGVALLGHDVINHKRFAVMQWDPGKPNQISVAIQDLPEHALAGAPHQYDKDAAPARVPHDDLGEHLNSAEELARIGKRLQGDENAFQVITTDANNNVAGIMSVPISALKEQSALRLLGRLRQFMRDTGGQRGFAVNVPEGADESGVLRKAIETGALTDVHLRDKGAATVRETGLLVPGGRKHEVGRAGSRGYRVAEQAPGYRERPVPAEDPNYTMFPMELPEAVDFMRQMAGGLTFPKVRQKLRALRGAAAGVYHGGPPGSVELRADIFNLIQNDDLVRLDAEAEAYVAANVPDEAEGGPWLPRAEVKKAWLKDAIRKLREERLQENPRLAGEVAWHEIGHWIDDVPDWAVNRRGNILGHVAALRNYTKDMLEGVPDDGDNLLGGKERAKLRREAEKAAGKRPKQGDAEGLKAWREDVKVKYQEALDAVAKERGLVRKQDILAELEPAIAWWYGAEKIPAYFTKPEEMYAAAFSILANNPAALKARAPTFWALWHEYQVRRPEVRQRWEEYQHQAAAGRIQNERDRRQADAIRAADVAAERAMRAKVNLTGSEFAEALGMFLFRGSLPVTLRAGRAGAEVKSRALKALQDQLYHEGWASAYMLRAGNEVGRKVFAEAGVPAAEWSLFLQNIHIAENRQDIASMLGMNPAASQASLDEQRARLGDKAFEAMRGAAEKWAELRQRYVIGLARETGIWSEELYKTAMQRVWYSTVKGVDLDKDPLEAAFRGMHGGEVGPKVYKQKGYLGAARDPWAATLELDRSLVAAAYRNKLKSAVRALLADVQDPLFREGRMRFDRNTNRQVPETGATDRAETVVYLEDGKPRSFWAPRAVAEFIESADPFSTVVFQRFLQMAARDIKGVFTYWNYGFPLFNTPRDIADWVIKLPGWKTKATYYQYAKRAKPLVDSILRGEPSPEAVEMLEQNILMLWPQGLTPGSSTTLQTLGNLIPGPVGRTLQRTGPQTAIERLANAYKVPGGWLGMDLTRRQELVRAAADWYTRPTARGELLRKVAGWMFLADRFPNMSVQERQRLVQMMAGSPNFADKPQGNWLVDTFIPFWNAAWRGTESTWKAVEWDVKNNRPYHADFWKTLGLTMRYGMIPKLILAGLAAGWFRKAMQNMMGDEDGGRLSDEYQRMALSIPDYYKKNYAAYPVWWDPTDRPNGRKVIFVTNPLSEHTRFGSGLMWQLLQGKSVEELLDFGADGLPGYNPVGTVALAWMSAARGRAPKWAGVSQTAVDAGQWVGPMTKYTLNNLLGGMVGRFPRETIEEEFKSPLQKFLALPVIGNTLGRRVRVSDAGWRDLGRDAARPLQDRAKIELQRAYDAARVEARTGRLPDEAVQRYAEGAAILAGRLDDQIGYLPPDMYLAAYYAQALRRARREMEIQRLPADRRAAFEAPPAARRAVLDAARQP